MIHSKKYNLVLCDRDPILKKIDVDKTDQAIHAHLLDTIGLWIDNNPEPKKSDHDAWLVWSFFCHKEIERAHMDLIDGVDDLLVWEEDSDG
jgi:hypothetical protein